MTLIALRLSTGSSVPARDAVTSILQLCNKKRKKVVEGEADGALPVVTSLYTRSVPAHSIECTRLTPKTRQPNHGEDSNSVGLLRPPTPLTVTQFKFYLWHMHRLGKNVEAELL